MRLERMKGTRVTVVVGVAMVAAALLLLAGCGGKVPSPIEMVPQGADSLMDVQVGKIFRDPDVEGALSAAAEESGQPGWLDKLLDEFQADTGIDLRALSRVSSFEDTSREGYTALIAKGSFDEDAMMRKLGEAADTASTSVDYKGYTLHVFEGAHAEGIEGPMVLAVLDSDTAILGSEEAVREVVDVVEGDRNSVSGEVLDRFNSLGDVWFKMVQAVPPDAVKNATELLTNVPMALGLFSDLQFVDMVVDKKGQDLIMRAVLGFATEKSAKDAGDALDGVVKLLRTFVPDKKVRGVLDSVEVTTEGSSVTVTLEAPVTDLESFMDGVSALGDIAGGGGLR